MKIYVKGITGSLHTLEMKEGADVAVLRQRLEELEGIPAEQLVMIYAGQELRNGAYLREYGLGKYNTEGDAMIYLQTRLAEPVHIFLAIPSSSRPPICEIVEADLPLEEVLRLLWAHGLMEKFDPEHCRVFARRDDGTTIVAARFDLSHSVEQVLRSVSRFEGTNVTALTFMSAPDGNLQVIASRTSKPYENTHAPFERPHAAAAPITRTRLREETSGAAGDPGASNGGGSGTGKGKVHKDKDMSWAAFKRELCIRE